MQAYDQQLHSPEWFQACFKDCTAPEWCQDAAAEICKSFYIRGICDPAYIANVIYGGKDDTTKTAERLHFAYRICFNAASAHVPNVDIIRTLSEIIDRHRGNPLTTQVITRAKRSPAEVLAVTIKLRGLTVVIDDEPRDIYVGLRTQYEAGLITDALDNQIYFYCEDEVFAKGSDSEIATAAEVTLAC